LKWLKANGCPWDEYSVFLPRNHPDVVVWLQKAKWATRY